MKKSVFNFYLLTYSFERRAPHVGKLFVPRLIVKWTKINVPLLGALLNTNTLHKYRYLPFLDAVDSFFFLISLIPLCQLYLEGGNMLYRLSEANCQSLRFCGSSLLFTFVLQPLDTEQPLPWVLCSASFPFCSNTATYAVGVQAEESFWLLLGWWLDT